MPQLKTACSQILTAKDYLKDETHNARKVKKVDQQRKNIIQKLCAMQTRESSKNWKKTIKKSKDVDVNKSIPHHPHSM